MTLILQFGLNMIVPIVMCTLLGAWLGKKYGMPIITVPLFIMGALAGFNNIFKMAKKIYGQENVVSAPKYVRQEPLITISRMRS